MKQNSSFENPAKRQKNTLGRLKNTPVGKLAAAILYILLLFACSYSTCDSAGLWRTLPLIFFLPPIATLLFNRKRETVLVCAICTLLLCLFDGTAVIDAALLTAAAVLFASFGMLLKRLIVTAIVNHASRRFCCITAGVGALIGLLLYAALFGNPIGGHAARARNAAYLAEAYGEHAPSVKTVLYSPRERRYFSRITFPALDTSAGHITAQVASDKNGVCDGYRKYLEYVLLSERRDELESFLSARFSVGDYALRIDSIKDGVSITADSTVEELAAAMRFEIAFTDGMPDEKIFADRCKTYCAALADGGIVYDSITFYGGIADQFRYRLTCCATDDAIEENDVEPFEETAFTRYYSEEDYADHWKRGS